MPPRYPPRIAPYFFSSLSYSYARLLFSVALSSCPLDFSFLSVTLDSVSRIIRVNSRDERFLSFAISPTREVEAGNVIIGDKLLPRWRSIHVTLSSCVSSEKVSAMGCKIRWKLDQRCVRPSNACCAERSWDRSICT